MKYNQNTGMYTTYKYILKTQVSILVWNTSHVVNELIFMSEPPHSSTVRTVKLSLVNPNLLFAIRFHSLRIVRFASFMRVRPPLVAAGFHCCILRRNCIDFSLRISHFNYECSGELSFPIQLIFEKFIFISWIHCCTNR